MVMIVVNVLLSTINCSTWRGDSSGDLCYEVDDDYSTNSNTYLVGFSRNPLTLSFTESRDSG